MAYCKQCGNELMPDSSFCSYCGASVPQEPISAPDDLSPVIPDTSPVLNDSPVDAAPPAPIEPQADVERPVFAEPLADIEPPVSAEPPADVEQPISAEPSANMEPPMSTEYTAPPPPEVPLVEAPPAAPASFASPAPPAPPAVGPYSVYDKSRGGFGRITFVNGFLTIVLLGSLLIAASTLGLISSRLFMTIRSLENIASQFSLYAMIAMAVALSTRAKGPDLSIGSLMTLSAVFIAMNYTAYGSPIIAILIAVGMCAVIGLISGVLINYVGISALIVTLLANLLVRVIAYMLTMGSQIIVRNTFITSIAANGLGALILVSLAFLIAFLMILSSRLGRPLYKREKKHPVSYMFAYMGSAIIAALAGIMVLSLYGVANSSIGTGYEPFILFVYGCIISSSALDNRIGPALYAFAPALVIVILNTVILLLGFASPVLTIVQCGLALAFILLGYLIRPELRGKIPALKS